MGKHPEIRKIRHRLLSWYHAHKRDLPWRRTRDPYAIWLSEIMLQQTTVETVIPYYQKFLKKFPDAQTLSQAKEADILAAWAGLGYYNRIRNFQKACRQLVEEGRNIPKARAELEALPGLGPYTARAVVSIAFGQPEAVVDGNVLRVLARLLACSKDIASSQNRGIFQKMADDLLDRVHPGDFNQALMELGATVCLPQKPQCLLCPIKTSCRAFKDKLVEKLPVKTKKTKYTDEKFACFVVTKPQKILLRQRKSPEIMAGLWEFPLKSQSKDLSQKYQWRDWFLKEGLPFEETVKTLNVVKHTIMTKRMTITPFMWESQTEPQNPSDLQWVSFKELKALPLTTITRKVLKLFNTSPKDIF